MIMKSYRRCIRASSLRTSSTTLGSGNPERLSSAGKHIQRPVAANRGRYDRFGPGRASRNDSGETWVRPDPQNACDTARCWIDIDEQRTARFIRRRCGQICRNGCYNCRIVSRDGHYRHARFHRRDMEIKSSIALGDHIDKRGRFDICLTPAALDDDFRGPNDCQHPRAADLFGLTRVGDVRPFQLRSE